MKILSKVFLLSTLAALGLSSCGTNQGSQEPASNPSEEPTSITSAITSEGGEEEESSIIESSEDLSGKVQSNTLYVKKVENLSDDFYCGMDCSSVISLEAGGTKFYDFEGNETDLLKVLADNGVNLIRVRIWNDPFDAEGHGYGGGNCNIDTAVAIGKRATQYGMKLLANFHYSDSWADPGRQTAPKAWKSMTVDQKAEALYTYTKESMQKLKTNNVDVGMVQVGNETNNFSMAGEKGIESFAKLFNQGYRAVKEVYPEALVACHFTNPEKKGYEGLAIAMQENNVNYDVFGSSYYPFYHGTLTNLKNQLSLIGNDYGKKVMVMETSYAYTDEDTDQCGNSFSSTSNYPHDYPVSIAGQANNYRNVVNAVASIKNQKGIGVVYWEGTWITASPKQQGESDVQHWTRLEQIWSQYGSGWSSKYAKEYDKEAPKDNSAGTVVDNQAFFDQYGKPLESLKVFNLVRYGNEDVPQYSDGVESSIVNADINDTLILPDTAEVILNTNERVAKPVTWNQQDIDAIEKKPGSYEVKGVVDAGDKQFNTICTVSLTASGNYIRDGSFENGGKTDWTLTNNISESYQFKFTNGDANNPIDGTWTCHAYTSGSKLNFECVQVSTFAQDLSGLSFCFNITGGANSTPVPKSSQNIYAYIKAGDDVIVKVDGYITQWGDKLKFETTEPISLSKGVEYTIGVHLEVTSSGAWLDLDAISLY